MFKNYHMRSYYHIIYKALNYEIYEFTEPLFHEQDKMVYLLLLYEIDTVTQVEIMNVPIYISNRANILGKGMSPSILPPAMCE